MFELERAIAGIVSRGVNFKELGRYTEGLGFIPANTLYAASNTPANPAIQTTPGKGPGNSNTPKV